LTRCKKPTGSSIIRATAKADGTEFESDPARFRRLALTALKPWPDRRAMADVAHEAIWFEAFWAINCRADFIRAMEI
jgi:hypothetical protein